mmetsp:Transcript_12763/g.42103  ORF Transcript_12763/g.42103 Transcript_12763/m.42103 type:complete len:281 (+) Transcript_12763:30-872(+)
MQHTVTTNDGVPIVCDVHESSAGNAESAPTVLLIHGWSGSRRYFDPIVPHLVSAGCKVVALDLRFHGDSGRPGFGYRVPRLAADVRDVLAHLNLSGVVGVGTSLGASVLWSYYELFVGERFSKMVFVDQAPLQNKVPGWEIGSTGCYDAETLAGLRAALKADMAQFAKENAEACLGGVHSLPSEVDALLAQETLRCDPSDLGQLMASHTQSDWRTVLPTINLPCVCCVGAKTKIFPVDGVKYVGENVPDCTTVVFEDSGHWLYLEEPVRFANLVADFAKK